MEIEAKSVNFAPPAPPLHSSAWFPAAQFQLMLQPPGWVGDLHCAPMRVLFCILAGGFGVEIGTGERREFPAGTMVLAEDTTGEGHRSWTVGDVGLLTAVIQVPDDALLK